ncbi:molecular chaperone DnaK-like protein, partial [Leptotrombidium deliense]
MDHNSSKNNLLSLIYNLHEKYLNKATREKLKEKRVKKIQKIVNQVNHWMIENPRATENDYDTQITIIEQQERYAERKLNEVANEAVEEFIGIDFGTDSCCLSVFKNNEWSTLLEHNSNIPSYVAFADDILIGKKAKDHYSLDNKNTIYSMKRFLGMKGLNDFIIDR